MGCTAIPATVAPVNDAGGVENTLVGEEIFMLDSKYPLAFEEYVAGWKITFPYVAPPNVVPVITAF